MKSTTKQISNIKRITNGLTYIQLTQIYNKLRSFSKETTREVYVFLILLET
jgi:hypothetical protein